MNNFFPSQWFTENFPDLYDLAPLSQGGQKLVYSAKNHSGAREVLKIIYPNTDIESVRREVLAVQKIQSSRVPKIFAYGKALSSIGECFWFREELVSGDTLRTILSSGPLEPKDILRLGVHILEALRNAEQAQIVHRDVKPENIMRDLSGNYWLLDFGIARHLQLTSLTNTANLFGKMTLGYAPPEQFRNLKPNIDSRADLFALGVTLHECVFGFNPFMNPPVRDAIELMQRVERVQLPDVLLPLSKSKDFRDLISAMTQKSKLHRPRDVEFALQWLTEICNTEGWC